MSGADAGGAIEIVSELPGVRLGVVVARGVALAAFTIAAIAAHKPVEIGPAWHAGIVARSPESSSTAEGFWGMVQD